MVKVVEGNIFDSRTDFLCHQVNCRGAMGSGIAGQIREKYPVVYTKYKELYDKTEDKSSLLGRVQFVTVSDTRCIVNIFGQLEYGGMPGVLYTDYNALKTAFNFLGVLCSEAGYSIALPYNFGCGLANGDWDKVYDIIRLNMPANAQCEIWKLDI